MATKVPTDEKLEKQDVDLFEVLAALDRKDYHYYEKLSPEQQKKIIPFMLVKWMSAIKGNEGLSRYYVMSSNEYANKYLFNEYVMKHPKLQWMMLCASSPGLGKQFHQWIPQIKEKVTEYKENANFKDIKEYYKKIYPKANDGDISEVANAFVSEQKRKVYFAHKFPNMKLDDIEIMNQIVTDEEIQEYERSLGN